MVGVFVSSEVDVTNRDIHFKIRWRVLSHRVDYGLRMEPSPLRLKELLFLRQKNIKVKECITIRITFLIYYWGPVSSVRIGLEER